MKRTKFIFIFIALVGIGFYFGTQSVIPGQGLFFAEVDERGPANELSPLDKVLPNLQLKDEEGKISIIGSTDTEESIPLCNLVDVISYTAVLDVQGVNVSGAKVQFLVRGTCERGELLAFHPSVCQMHHSLFDSWIGIDAGFEMMGLNLLNPFAAQNFSLVDLKIMSRDGIESQAYPLPDTLKTPISCPSL